LVTAAPSLNQKAVPFTHTHTHPYVPFRTAEGKKEAVDTEHVQEQVIWRLNVREFGDHQRGPRVGGGDGGARPHVHRARAPLLPAAAHTLKAAPHSSNHANTTQKDFPYNFEGGVEHHLVWANAPIAAPALGALIAGRFPGREALHFVNPAALQSILSVWHAHVLVRDAPPPARAS
jgi:hypothetical protein